MIFAAIGSLGLEHMLKAWLQFREQWNGRWEREEKSTNNHAKSLAARRRGEKKKRWEDSVIKMKGFFTNDGEWINRENEH